jgi:hypothetical protein
MLTSNTTQVNTFDDCGNSLLAELAAQSKAYKEAKKAVTEENPFLTYFNGGNSIELGVGKTLQATYDEPSALYIVAPDSEIETFSMIQRKPVSNRLGDLSGSSLRRALGTLLDNA